MASRSKLSRYGLLGCSYNNELGKTIVGKLLQKVEDKVVFAANIALKAEGIPINIPKITLPDQQEKAAARDRQIAAEQQAAQQAEADQKAQQQAAALAAQQQASILQQMAAQQAPKLSSDLTITLPQTIIPKLKSRTEWARKKFKMQ